MSVYKALIKSILLFLLFIFVSAGTFAQQNNTANIRGFVYLKETGEPILFTNVVLKGTSMGIATDVNGFFSITKVPPGSYTIMVASALGYDTLQEPITVKAGEIVNKKLYLVKSNIKLKTIEISASQESKETETQVSVNKIDPINIKRLPSVGGQPDLVQYLQVLPGVIFTGDQGGQLYIRGGSPIQNKVLLDGMIVYNPFHSSGLFSVFDADIIRNADVYSGGFGAEYGGRISAIMDVSTREGNKKRVAGKLDVSPFGAKALVEGPLQKYTEGGNGTSSFIFSAKTSYLPETSKMLYSYAAQNGQNNLPFSFTDYYGKISFNANNGSKLNLFGFDFNDAVNYSGLAQMKWQSYGGGGNFLLVPQNSPILVNGNFAYSQYGINYTPYGQSTEFSSIKGFNMGIGFTYFMGKSEINYGLDIDGFSTNLDFYNSAHREITQLGYTTEIGGYLKYKWVSKHNKLVIEPSFRLQYYASLANASPEPRINAKWNITHKVRFKAAAGMYSQNLISTTTDREVVNLFQGFLTGPDNLPTSYVNESGETINVKSKLQKANHYVAGFEFDLAKHLEMNVEGYIKDFTQLTNINPYQIYDNTPANQDKPSLLTNDYIIETGVAKGIDVTFKYEYRHFYLWVVYDLGFINQWDGVQNYRTIYDRRHNGNIVASYTFGRNLNWDIGARWSIGSGFPYNPTGGFYENLNFQGGINSNYASVNGNMAFFLANGQVHELPWYHRLDINIKRTFQLFQYCKLDVSAGATNVYNRANVFYVPRTDPSERINQLPIMPTVSVVMIF